MRIFVLGRPGSGKSNLITAIFGVTDHVDRSSCDDGVTTHTWTPPDADRVADENDDDREEVEIWEWSGKRIYRGLQSFFFTGNSLYLLCLSSDDVITAEECIQTWIDIHYKVSSPDIMVVLTQSYGNNKIPSTQSRKTALVKCIKRIQKNHIGADRTTVFESLTNLERSLISATQPEVPIFVIDLYQKKGIDKLKMAIHRNIKTKEKWISQVAKEQSTVKKILRDITSSKNLLIKESDFLKNMKISKDDKETLLFLEAKNVILRLFPVTGESMICTDPRRLARLMVSVHVVDQPRVYQFDSRKFWGADLSRRPDPGVLVKTLEDVAKQGVLRESLIPLLWQNVMEKEGDVIQLIEVLIQLGVILQCNEDSPGGHEITLENFPRLQHNRKFYVTQVGLIPNKKPTLSWTPTPAADDIEITVRFSTKLELPSGFKPLLLGSCQNVCLSQEPNYIWTWSNGVLVQYQKEKVSIRIDLLADTVDMRGRTIAPDHASKQEAVGAIWTVLSHPLAAIENIKCNWKNLALERSVRMVDNSCPGPEFLRRDQDHFIPVSEIFCEKEERLIPFPDLPSGCDYFGFLKFLAAKTKVKTLDCNKSDFPRKIQKERNNGKSDWKRKNSSQRKQITWILHKNPHSSKMTSAEGVTGLDKKQKSQHASVNSITNDANKDLLLIELVNGFVQEILRKGIAKYQEDINAQRPKVKWSISAVTSFHATNVEKPDAAKMDASKEVQTTADCSGEPNAYRRSKLCQIL
uniref:Uncharacterized protein LOC111105910 isoform X1 n=2 Tax=Crassostrea virginica TaxID=6565 RepID=A0A8B8AY74_CRAVI|nr:uncharacterized protein LOC111105910 isoform X1 [Crassostrea virginica]